MNRMEVQLLLYVAGFEIGICSFMGTCGALMGDAGAVILHSLAIALGATAFTSLWKHLDRLNDIKGKDE